jgi:hypothetical protein
MKEKHMKKALSVFALIALALSLNFGVVHAQRGASGPSFCPQWGGWNRPMMGGQRGWPGMGGYNRSMGGNRGRQGWGMCPGYRGRGGVLQNGSQVRRGVR